MRILGIVGETHDSGLALLQDGVPELVLEEERLNRIKKTTAFPHLSLAAAFETGAVDFSDVDVITIPWHPRQLSFTYLRLLARRFPLSLALLHPDAHGPQSLKIIYINEILWVRLKQKYGGKIPPIVNVGHHNSHAAYYFVSGFEDATVLVMDGYGDDCSTSVYTGTGNRLQQEWSNRFLDSLGVVFTVITEYLGFASFGDEGKVMGLAAYGDDTFVEKFKDFIHLTDDGGYRINMDYFSYDRFGQLRPFKKKFYDQFGPAAGRGETPGQRAMDISFALQSRVEEAILHMVRALLKRYPSKNLVLSGGVAMNCVANAKILTETDYERIWIPPSASDSGVPLGSALWHHYQDLDNPRNFELTHAYYGQSYSDDEIEKALDAAGLSYERLDERELLSRVGKDIADGNIIGWLQGRFEMGPRALGNRSILADPRRAEMKDIINARVKHREAFRPFAPVVMAEHASDYFEIDQPDPFMTIAPKVRPDKVDAIPAVVHEDMTGRFQTVDRAGNARYYGVIEAFYKLTGVPVILNTSFNKQEPIVSTPAEAISCFLRTDMDVLALGNYYSTDRSAAAIKQAHDLFGAE